MKEIRIGRLAQLGIVGGLAAAVVAAVAFQEPEIRRYLKMRSM